MNIPQRVTVSSRNSAVVDDVEPNDAVPAWHGYLMLSQSAQQRPHWADREAAAAQFNELVEYTAPHRTQVRREEALAMVQHSRALIYGRPLVETPFPKITNVCHWLQSLRNLHYHARVEAEQREFTETLQPGSYNAARTRAEAASMTVRLTAMSPRPAIALGVSALGCAAHQRIERSWVASPDQLLGVYFDLID